jgi:phosphate transport system permease protein
MTDISVEGVLHPARKQDWESQASARRVKRRHAANARLRFYGLFAISLAIGLLGILVGSLIFNGYTAFYQSKAELEVSLEGIDPGNIDGANYRRLFNNAIERYFPDVTSAADKRRLADIFSSESRYVVRDYVRAHPDRIGHTVKLKVSLSDPFDQLEKGVIPRYVEALRPWDKALFEDWRGKGRIDSSGETPSLTLDLVVDPAKVSAADVNSGQFKAIIEDALRAAGGNAGPSLAMLRSDAEDIVKGFVAANPDRIGTTLQNFKLPLAAPYAELAGGKTPMTRNERFASEKQFEWLDRLKAQGLISYPFATELFVNPTSRFPELAGLAGAAAGSFLALLVCFLISFPLGIAAAVYLEEFAPKNRLTDLIEVNINNLAAEPSVEFGLLGLAVFINAFGLPRSAPLVGGMVLALITLPTIIITTRAALKAVPPSIREAALGVGASRHQVVMHHVLPLAMPGILTGVIIGLAHALGETAPLLLIGMNAFIPSIENIGLLDPATAFPTQIYAWADSPERGFVARTSAAILVLLGFLVAMNAIAIFLRQRFERKW